MDDFSKLSEDERARFLTLIAELFVLFDGLYRQHKMGFLPAESWEEIESTVGRMFSNPAIEAWWETRVSMTSVSFRRHVHELRKRSTDPGWIDRMTEQILNDKSDA